MVDIYKTPEADLSEVEKSEVEKSDIKNRYYVVSKTKFSVLFLTTYGLYSLYWFYKNWNKQKYYRKENIRPVWRSIFAIFYIGQLFKRIDEEVKSESIEYGWSPVTSATVYVIAALVGYIADRVTTAADVHIVFSFIPIVTMLFQWSVLLEAQKVINLVSNDKDGKSNSNFSTANIAWIVFTFLIWSLAIYGAFFVES